MAIVDYASLQTAIARWLHRSDLTASIPDFIRLAEVKLNRRLRIGAMELRDTGTSVAGVIALPTGYRGARSLHISQGGSWRRLDFETPERAGEYPASGYASAYTVVGSNIELLPAPSENVDYRLVYFKQFDPLENSQNWLILNAPDVYLYASLLESAPFLKADARLETWNALLEAAIADLEQDDRDTRAAGNTMGIKTDNTVRLG